MYKKSLLTAAIAGVVCAGAASGAITVLNSDGASFDDSNGANNIYNMENSTANTTFSFDAGATADKIIVQYSSEGGGNAVITYAGETLTKIAGTSGGRNQGMYYLDLAGTGYAGGAADLVIDMTANAVVNGLGYGVVSVSGTALGFTDLALQTSSESVSITPTVADSFVIAGYGSNGGGTVGVPGSLTQLYNGSGSNNNAIGSAAGASGYQNGVPASLQTYTFNDAGEDGPVSSAVAFAPIPEPSSLALLGLGGLLIARRRR